MCYISRSLDKNFFTGGALTYVFRRCMPLDMPEIDISKPVVISEVPVHHPAMITVDGRQYTIDSSYIAQHPNRYIYMCVWKNQIIHENITF